MKQKTIQLILFFLLIKTTPLYSITSDCEILKYTTRCEVKDNKLLQIDTIVIQINNRNGERYSTISIPYSSLLKVSGIEGWIIDSNGKKVKTLKSSEIEDRNQISNQAFFKDGFIKILQLKHNSYPYNIYYTYKTSTTDFITIADWSPVIFSNISTIKALLFITIPKKYLINKYVRGAELIRTDTIKDGIEFEFSSKYNRINTNQIYSVPLENINPRIVIVPNNFFYGVEGKSDSWVDFGNWFLKLNKGLFELPESEKKVINELISGIVENKEKVKKLYYYLQDNTRYVNVSIGLGGFKSYSASYVAQNKYGDCKALTIYMKALLDYVGIKSNFTLINSSLQPENINEELPYSQFNHIILCVPFKTDTMWIENTSNSCPIGYVSSYIQNRKALLISENNSHLINIPNFKIKNVTINRKINITCNSLNDVEALARFEYKGYLFDLFNQINTDLNKREQDKVVREYIPFRNFELIDWQLIKLNRDSSSIMLKSKFKIYDLFNALGNDFFLSILPILKNSYEPPTERSLPLQIPYPLCNIDSVIYTLKNNLEVKRAPKPVAIKSQVGEYDLTVKKDGNTIIVYKRLLILPTTYSLEQYQIFYDFILKVKEAEKNVILLRTCTSKL